MKAENKDFCQKNKKESKENQADGFGKISHSF